MADEPVIIVDEAGNEHEFPAGMDPKRAGAIVREKTYQPGKLANHTLSGDTGNYPEGVNPADRWQNKAAAGLEPLAHPQGVGDLAALAIPGGMGAALAPYLKPMQEGASKYGGAAVDLATSFLPKKGQAALKVLGELRPTNWHNPLTVAGRDARAAAESMKAVVPNLAEDIGPHVLRGADQFREPYQTPAPNAGQPTIDELRKAGVGKGSLDLLQGRKPMSSVTPIAAHETPAELHATTSPEAGQRLPHPAWSRINAQPAIEPMPSHGQTAPPNVADVNVSTPLGDPKVVHVNPKYPWSPEQSSQIRLGMSDWHSGAPSGTPAAKVAQGAHIEDHMLDQRYRQLLSDPKAALLLPLLAPQVREALLAQMHGEPQQ